MTLKKEQIKITKSVLAENGKSEKFLIKEFTESFWDMECNGSFEGYLNWLIGYEPVTPFSFWLQAHKNIMSGKAGASHFN